MSDAEKLDRIEEKLDRAAEELLAAVFVAHRVLAQLTVSPAQLAEVRSGDPERRRRGSITQAVEKDTERVAGSSGLPTLGTKETRVTVRYAGSALSPFTNEREVTVPHTRFCFDTFCGAISWRSPDDQLFNLTHRSIPAGGSVEMRAV